MINRTFAKITLILLGIFLIGLVAIKCILLQLPDVNTLKDVKLQVPLRIFSKDNKLIAEFGEKRRTPVTIESVPKQLIDAFISIEDRRFYNHFGVDFVGISRAVYSLISKGSKEQGGSTITMQVARNFFLHRKKTFSRKMLEILLALKIERELTKSEILELYINKVFLGHRAYGVVAAAKVYYGKKLSELTLSENAMLAGLPKAPSSINPLTNNAAALRRRNQVLASMKTNGYISDEEMKLAKEVPNTATYHQTAIELNAPYIAEMVRVELINNIGEQAYTDGLQVYTTLDSRLQNAGHISLIQGLQNYDRRHGFRKPENISETNDYSDSLANAVSYENLQPAIVKDVLEKSVTVFMKDAVEGEIDWDGLSWAKPMISPLRYGYMPEKASDILRTGDFIYIAKKNNKWVLGQLPEIEGAIVSLEPKSGAILSLVGGFSFKQSKFNRVTQAELQPGSSFKPFVYAAALANGFTPATVINDAPIIFSDPADEEIWRPQNANRKFSGPTSLRQGLIKSRNLVSIRLLNHVGVKKTIEYISRFGFRADNMPKGLSLALGTANVTPLELARGYAIIANGGYDVIPHFIAEIKNGSGETIYNDNHPIVCEPYCNQEDISAEQVIDPRDAYIMTNLLQDAVKNGTGRGARRIGRKDIAGKTGTTNDQLDAWFSGFNGDIVTTVWTGFDNPRSLGEYAARVALPIWTDYMQKALSKKKLAILPQPAGLITVKIDPKTGLRATSKQKSAIYEIFKKENLPNNRSASINEVYKEKNTIPEQIF